MPPPPQKKPPKNNNKKTQKHKQTTIPQLPLSIPQKYIIHFSFGSYFHKYEGSEHWGGGMYKVLNFNTPLSHPPPPPPKKKKKKEKNIEIQNFVPPKMFRAYVFIKMRAYVRFTPPGDLFHLLKKKLHCKGILPGTGLLDGKESNLFGISRDIIMLELSLTFHINIIVQHLDLNII